MKIRMKRFGLLLLAGIMFLSVFGCTLQDTAMPTDMTAEGMEGTTVMPEQTDGYTYRDSVQQLPSNWSPQNWKTESDAYIMNLTSTGLYSIAIAGNGTSYALEPEMAAGEPVDVTAAYAGNETYGVPSEAESGYAYQIDLNPRACWDDGTAINADTYLYSMEQMLSSTAKHFRAASYYSGQLCIANAYSYYMQDQVGTAYYCSLADAGYSSVAEAVNDGIQGFYLDMDSFWGMDCGWISINSTRRYRDEAVMKGQEEDYVSANYLYKTYLAEGAAYAAYQTTFVGILVSQIQKTDFSQVGLIKTGEYQITLVLSKPISSEALQVCLRTGWLVMENLYTQNYGTSVETSASYGPYRLTELGADYFRLERNESWYGYTDGNHQDQYQSTGIVCLVLADEADAMEAFENGLLDTVTLSDAVQGALVTPQTYISKLTFNTSLTALKLRESENINKTILYYRDFRRAISLAIDRASFVEECVPAGTPALGLLADTFISDLAAGESYRESEAGRAVLTALYDSEDGESITGYDLQTASALFQQAYDAALSDGNIGQNDMVELEFLIYSDDAIYTGIANHLQDVISMATVGTSLENRVRIVTAVDSDYYNTTRNGQFEIVLSTWGGVASDPYSIMSCYCEEEKKFEFGFEPNVENCTIVLEETQITKTYRGWYEALVNGKYAGADTQIRNEILSKLEYALLNNYDCVPLYQRNQFTLDSQRVVRPVEQALPLIGFGGVRYVSYTCDDAVWAEQTGASF